MVERKRAVEKLELQWGKAKMEYSSGVEQRSERKEPVSGRKKRRASRKASVPGTPKDLTKAYIEWLGSLVDNHLNRYKWIEHGPFEWSREEDEDNEWDAYIITF